MSKKTKRNSTKAVSKPRAKTVKKSGAKVAVKKAATVKKKKTASAQGRASRTKGHSYERWVANRMKTVYPYARRQLEYHQDDANGIDIQGTDEFKIQCKKMKKYAPISCIEEIQCGGDDIPVLVTSGDGMKPMAVLPFDRFVELVGVYRHTVETRKKGYLKDVSDDGIDDMLGYDDELDLLIG